MSCFFHIADGDVGLQGSNTAGLAGNASAAAAFASAHLFDYTGDATGGFGRNGLGNKMLYSVPGMTVTSTGSGTSASGTMSGAYLVGTDGKINPNATLLYDGNGEGSVSDVLLTPRFRQEYNVAASGSTTHVATGMKLSWQDMTIEFPVNERENNPLLVID